MLEKAGERVMVRYITILVVYLTNLVDRTFKVIMLTMTKRKTTILTPSQEVQKVLSTLLSRRMPRSIFPVALPTAIHVMMNS